MAAPRREGHRERPLPHPFGRPHSARWPAHDEGRIAWLPSRDKGRGARQPLHDGGRGARQSSRDGGRASPPLFIDEWLFYDASWVFGSFCILKPFLIHPISIYDPKNDHFHFKSLSNHS